MISVPGSTDKEPKKKFSSMASGAMSLADAEPPKVEQPAEPDPMVTTTPPDKGPALSMDEIEMPSGPLTLQELHSIASDHDPDDQAAAWSAWKRTGIPASQILQNPEWLKKAKVPPPYLAKWAERNPLGAGYLSDHPEAMGFVFDDMESVGKLERVFTVMKDRWKSGVNEMKANDLAFRAMMGDQEAAKKLATEYIPSAQTYQPRGWLEKSLGATTEILPNMIEGVQQGSRAMKAFGMKGILAPIHIRGTLKSGKLMLDTNFVYGILGSAGQSFRQESGGIWRELSEMRDSNGNQVDPQAKFWASVLGGGVSATLETIGEFIQARSIPGVGKIWIEAVKKASIKMATNPSFLKLLAKFGLEMGKEIGGETVTEVGQELTAILAGEAAKEYTNMAQGTDFEKISMEEATERLKEIAWQTILATPWLVAPGNVVSTTAGGFEVARAKRQKAADQENLESLGKALENNKLAERSPEHAKQFIEGLVSEDGAVLPPVFYVQAPKFQEQLDQAVESGKLTEHEAQDIIEKMGITPDDFAEAVGLEKAIAIPTPEIVTLFQSPIWDGIHKEMSSDPASEIANLDDVMAAAIAEKSAIFPTRELNRLIDEAVKAGADPEHAKQWAVTMGKYAVREAKETGQSPAEVLHDVFVQDKPLTGRTQNQGPVDTPDQAQTSDQLEDWYDRKISEIHAKEEAWRAAIEKEYADMEARHEEEQAAFDKEMEDAPLIDFESVAEERENIAEWNRRQKEIEDRHTAELKSFDEKYPDIQGDDTPFAAERDKLGELYDKHDERIENNRLFQPVFTPAYNPNKKVPLIYIKGNEVRAGGTRLDFRASARNYLLQHYLGKSIQNLDTKWDIQITDQGITHFTVVLPKITSSKAVAVLDQLIRGAAYKETVPPKPAKQGKKFDPRPVHIFVGAIVIDGELHRVEFAVKEGELIGADGHGDFKHYFIDKYYSHKTKTPKSRIGREMARNIAAEVANASPQTPSGLTHIKISELYQDVKEEPQKIDEAEHRGAVTFVDYGGIEQAYIQLFENADFSTLAHESFHIFRRRLERLSMRDGAGQQIRDDWARACEFVGAEVGQTWTRDQEEKWAKAGERYLTEGVAPTAELKTVFERIREWMLEIYEFVQLAGVDITPEIREVFDRLFATEEEINIAQADLELESLYRGQIYNEHLGDVSQDDLDQYQRMANKANAAIADEVNRRRVRELAQMRRQWLKEGEEYANSHPTWGLINDIATSNGIDLDSLRADFDGDTVTAISRKRPGLTRKKGGMGYDEIATQYGFEDGESMIMALHGVLPKKELARMYAEQQEEQWAEYFDTSTDVMPDEYMDLLDLEIEMLQKELYGKRAPRKYQPKPWRQAKSYIDRKMGIRPAREMVREDVALKASLRAQSRAARIAYSQGKKESALEAKIRQREMAMERKFREQERRDLIKFKNWVKRTLKSKPSAIDIKTGVAWEYMEQFRALLAPYGLVPPSMVPDPSTMQSLSSFVDEKIMDYEILQVPDWILQGNQSGKKFHQLTFDQAKELEAVARVLIHLGRQEKKLIATQRLASVDAAAREMTDTIYENKVGKDKTPKGYADLERTWFKSVKDWAKNYWAQLIKIEFITRRLDGYKDMGIVWQYLFQPLKKAEDAELALGARVNTELQKAYGKIKVRTRQQWSKQKRIFKNVYDPVKHDYGIALTKEQAIAVALNVGNDGNLEALRSGYNWTDAEIQEILDWLTQEEWALVQDIWRTINALYPSLADMHFKMTGVKPPKVVGRDVKTQFGTIQGNYFPLQFDSRISSRAEEIEVVKSLKDLAGNVYGVGTPSTRAGATHARTGGKLPPMLSLGVVDKHIKEVVHDITHRAAVRDVLKLIKREDIRLAIERTLGQEYHRQFVPWLQYIAQPQTKAQTEFEKTVGVVRKNATIVMLGLKFTVAAKQFLSYTQTVQAIGGKASLEGLVSFIPVLSDRKKIVEQVKKLSPAMAQRQTSWDREVANVRAHFNPAVKNVKEGATEVFFTLIGWMDSVAVYPTWWGAYQKALHEDSLTQAEAVEYADMIVRTTQPNAAPKDLAKIQRGGEFLKLFTMFYTFFSVFHNRVAELNNRFMDGKADVKDLFLGFWWLFILPAYVGTAINAGELPDDPEEIVGSMFSYAAGGMPGFRDLVNASVTDYGYSISPAVEGFETFGGLGHDAWNLVHHPEKVKGEQVAKKLVNAAGYAFGLPSKQILITASGFWDIAQGETKNPLRMLFPKRMLEDDE